MKKALAALGAMMIGSMLAGTAGAEVPGPAPTIRPIVPLPSVGITALVQLPCAGPGASDVVFRKHSIKNTTGSVIPKGTQIHWTASDKNKPDKGVGTVTLTADLAPNATVDVTEPGQTNGYTCTAGFYPTADLAVKSVQWTNATTATVVIQNVSSFADAGASTLHVESLKCLATKVNAVDAQVPAIPKGGGSTTVTVTIAKAGADYLQATANATNSIPESNRANNVGKSPEFGSNKSCTPQ